MTHLKPDRVKHALHKIHEWALSAKTQASAHLIPLLALLEAGAGTAPSVAFEENDDKSFWNKYFLIKAGDKKPYFNPITLRQTEEGYPHSNASTIRKNTFLNPLKWGAATTETGEEGETIWSLNSNYAQIFRDKVLIKGGRSHKIPVLDISALLLRDDEFSDGADADTLLSEFRKRFPQRDEDFRELFAVHSEKSESLFTNDPVHTPTDYDEIILEELVSERTSVPTSKSANSLEPLIDLNDPLLIEVQRLLELGSAGIIFKGPPGTGKTWYAHRIAATIVDDPSTHIFRVQFHPSFGYEDFVEGYKPEEGNKSGFAVVPKIFLKACEVAKKVDGYVVVIIDEINRGDPARVFGELLTYLEKDYRGQRFYLPFSGEETYIPERLLIFGTMNPYDRSVAQVDAAFVRRFFHIDVEPSPEAVQQILEASKGFSDAEIGLIVTWFENVQQMLDIGLGHTFFYDVKDLDRLKLVWKYSIWPTAESILEFNPDRRDDFIRAFEALVIRLEGSEKGT